MSQLKNEFLTKDESNLINRYLTDGYIIQDVSNLDALSWIREKFITISKNKLNYQGDLSDEDFLNSVHELISPEDVNDFRLHVIKEVNALPDFRKMYYHVVKPYLDTIVGNELSMQLRINVSIQLPDDDSSLLSVHADTWSGDSPFEAVVWIPLVDCYNTKSMYILPPKFNQDIQNSFSEVSGLNANDLYSSIKENVEWLKVKYGECLIFNQTIPHGNIVNSEKETRWTLNCRFKGVFTPYKDKKIGEFFEPINLRASSIAGLNYKLPTVL
jgi:sporadic carbohydrate cluster 2OG-Fe(II) oxygenase